MDPDQPGDAMKTPALQAWIHRSIVVLLLAVGTAARAETREPGVYDAIAGDYLPLLDPADELAWPLKVRSLAGDAYAFWRGSKLHFYRWSRDACRDWLADTRRFIPTHGDPHFGNIGSYPADTGWGEPGIGFVDFDETALLPPEFDLLQGWIMSRLAAERMKLPWTPRLREALRQTIARNYRLGATASAPVVELLADSPMAMSLLRDFGESYEADLRSLTTDGRFRHTLGNPSAPSDLLTATPELIEPIARALARWSASDPTMSGRLRYSSVESWRAAIGDVARRVRVKSVGSQGLKKYFVLVHSPLMGRDHDIVLYLKQQVLPPAERSGISAPFPAAPAERVARMTAGLTDPPPIVNGAVELAGESYWLLLREPWSMELDSSKWSTRQELLEAARIWATVAGRAHRHAGLNEPGFPSAETMGQVESRADEYLRLHHRIYAEFVADERVKELSRRAGSIVERVAAQTKS